MMLVELHYSKMMLSGLNINWEKIHHINRKKQAAEKKIIILNFFQSLEKVV